MLVVWERRRAGSGPDEDELLSSGGSAGERGGETRAGQRCTESRGWYTAYKGFLVSGHCSCVVVWCGGRKGTVERWWKRLSISD